ncbi:hypothetical protein G7046_g3931 [Stylonectria norvegica]|nr:hypothetical protein G7046_g3931 [Stylonectria norvegica]
MTDQEHEYSSMREASAIFDYLSSVLGPVSLPPGVNENKNLVSFTAHRDKPYFPIPFKETETAAALKAIEGSVASLLAGTKGLACAKNKVNVNLDKATAFLFQAYLAKVGGYGKLDKEVKALLKDTDLLQAQSIPYRRMSANLYKTKEPGQYYHIHGSLEASTTLQMIGLEPFRPDLTTHEQIVDVIEPAVQNFTVEELETMNAKHRQAGVKAYTHEDFLKTPHGKTNMPLPPWSVENLEDQTPKSPLPQSNDNRLLSGIKVLELCRIIAGPVITRILAEYGADVLKITSPHLSDVPMFQVDGNMGKHASELDLKTPEGRRVFDQLLAEADVVVDGYRPGALEKLGYGAKALTELAGKRGKGIVYVNENCFGYEGEWAGRPGWQQIADCASGLAWEQGKFLGLNEPVVPPFPISDYGTGCMGAITALVGLYHRATVGGSWHGRTSLLHYDLLLFKVGLLPAKVQDELRELAGEKVLALRHENSVDQISGAALGRMREVLPDFFKDEYMDDWYSEGYKAKLSAVTPVVEIDGLDISFKRAKYHLHREVSTTMASQTENQPLGQEFTRQVIQSMGPACSPRLKTIMGSFIQHIHDFAREVELTTDEWMMGVQMINEAGQISNEKRNEGQLMCDVIGLESLVDDITYRVATKSSNAPTQSAILGPFWRADAPIRENYSSTSTNTPKDAKTALMYGQVTCAETGKPIPNASVDVWQASTNGLYEQQDADQVDCNLRGKFITDSEGKYAIYCLRPTPYPLPEDGPTNKLLRLMDRDFYRPAHIHLIVMREGFKSITTQIFDDESKYLDDDTVFAVKDGLTVNFKPRENDPKADWTLQYDIKLAKAS